MSLPHLCAHCGRLFDDTWDGRVRRVERVAIEEHLAFGKIHKRWCSLECFVLDAEKERDYEKEVAPARR